MPRHTSFDSVALLPLPQRAWFARFAIFALLAVGCILTPLSVRAQEYSFSQIVIEGNDQIELPTVERLIGIGRGEAVSAGRLNDAFQRLSDSGLFETVTLEPQGDTLVVTVSEYPTINVISFEGNRRLDDEALLELIGSQSRRAYSPPQAETDAAAIAEAYRVQGRLAASVTPRIIRRDGNRVDLVFEIAEGRVVEVERLAFVGNRAFNDRRLRQVLETKQAGLLRTFVRSDTFIAERIELDKQLLRDFYASRGYADFEVLDATAELAAERDGFFVTFTIREGQSFRVGNVSTISEIPELSADEFAAVVRLRPGVTYNPAIIENNIARMENLAIRKGLNFVRVEPRITRDDRNLLLNVEFAIVRGERIFVERIDIEGNTTTLDEVIRRQFRSVEGDPFNPREIRRSAERIRALGFFSDAQVNTEPGSAPDQVLVNVDVVEQPTGSLTLGAAFSVAEGAALTFGFRETNFLGRGQTVSLDLSVGADDQNSTATFVEPAFLGRDLALRLSAVYTESNQSNADYDTSRIGFRAGLGFPVSESGRLELSYSLFQDEITNVDVDSSDILKREEARGSLLDSAIGYNYSFDTRTSGLNPLGGILLRFGQEFSGVGGDISAVTTNALALYERRVFNEDVTLRASFEGGAINNFDDEGSRVGERFNGSQIRGFERNGIGPRDLTAENEDALGGNFFAVARFEAEFPLGTPEEYGLRGALFLDTGSVWGLDDTAGTAGPVDDDFSLRSVIGVSLLWDTPVGPLRFNFTSALSKEDSDDEQNFDLTIATTF